MVSSIVIISCIIGVCFLCVTSFFLGVGWIAMKQEELREAREELEHYKVFFGGCEPVDSEVAREMEGE